MWPTSHDPLAQGILRVGLGDLTMVSSLQDLGAKSGKPFRIILEEMAHYWGPATGEIDMRCCVDGILGLLTAASYGSGQPYFGKQDGHDA